jgi:hypothetical protein
MPNRFQAIDARFALEPLPAAGEPIFLLAAGWRSGSTLLQRLAVSSGEALVWGEPYGRAGIIPALTQTALTFGPDWPQAAALAGDVTGVDLSAQWIANLYPEARSVRSAYRALLDELLRTPAERRGFGRFGLKEVRLSGVDAAWLEWLYPDARFVFLVRDPWDAWSSMKGSTWYWRWPDQPVSTATAFARVWTALGTTFRQWPGGNGMLLRYEDLTAPELDLERLRAHLRLSRIERSVRATKIRGPVQAPTPLDAREVAEIGAIAGNLAASFGYAAPTR